MESSYIAVFELPEEPGHPWSASFPDLPGCAASGRNFEDAMVNAGDALRSHVEGMRTFGHAFPRARTVTDLWAEKVFEGRCFPAQIDLVII